MATVTRSVKKIPSKKKVSNKETTKKASAKKTSNKKAPAKKSSESSPVEKVDVEVLSCPAHKIYSGIDKLDAKALHKEVSELTTKTSESFLRYGALLCRMAETGAYKAVTMADGSECGKLDDYASVIGMAPRQMYHHMRIHRTLVCEQQVDPDLLTQLGWAKSGAIAAITETSASDGKRLLKKAEKGMCLRDILEETKKIRAKLRGLPGVGEDISGAGTDTFHPVSFKLSTGAKEVVDKALDLFRKIEGDESIKIASMVEWLCADFINSNPQASDMKLKDHAELLGKTFGAKISWEPLPDNGTDTKTSTKSKKKGGKKLREKPPKSEQVDPLTGIPIEENLPGGSGFLDDLPTLDED